MRRTLKLWISLPITLLVALVGYGPLRAAIRESKAIPEVVWQPAIVRTIECRTFFVTRADRCTQTTIIAAVLESTGPYFEDILKTLRFSAEGGARWEDRQLYEVEITKSSGATFGGAKYLIRQRPNKAPEPTNRTVTIRAAARLAPARFVAHL